MTPEGEIDFEGVSLSPRPELHTEEAMKRVVEAGQGVIALPRILRLTDGRLVDSYDYLQRKKIEIIADQYPGWEEGWWYSTLLPSEFRGQPGSIVTGGFGDEAEEVFRLRNWRADASNTVLKEQIKPYIQVFPDDLIAKETYPLK